MQLRRSSAWLVLSILTGCSSPGGRDYGAPSAAAVPREGGNAPQTSNAPDGALPGDASPGVADTSDVPQTDGASTSPEDGASTSPEDAAPDADDADAGSTEVDAGGAQLDASSSASPVASDTAGSVTAMPTTPVSAAPDSGDCVMLETHVPNEGATHITEGMTATYDHNPPASGEHYGVYPNYGAYDLVVERPYWVHSLEHGAVVFLIGPSATPPQTEALRDAFDNQVVDAACDPNPRRLLTADPELPMAVAVVAWDYTLTGDCVDPDAIRAFVIEHVGQGPEQICGGGGFTPP